MVSVKGKEAKVVSFPCVIAPGSAGFHSSFREALVGNDNAPDTAHGALGCSEVRSGSGIYSISFDPVDHNSSSWLNRSTVGRWREVVNLLCIQEVALAAAIELQVAMVGYVYALISF